MRWFRLPRVVIVAGALLFSSTNALSLAPRAAFPSPCINGCYDEYRRCIAGYGSEAACSIRYNQCFGGCDRLSDGPLPQPVPRTLPLDLGDVPVGQVKRHVFRITNNVSKSNIKRYKATLYASWTPPEQGNLGKVSDPRKGPFALAYGYRWELKAGEGQNVAVDFAPTTAGKVHAPRLYLWWDSYTHFYWTVVFEVSGTGVQPAAPAPGAPSPGGVTSGKRGGLETVPLWMAADAGTTYRPPLWQNLNGLRAKQTAVTAPQARRRAVNPGRAVSVPLLDVIPRALGPITPVVHEPEAVIGGSNAVESLAADYIDPGTGAVRAVVLAFRTRNDVYAHVYPVCARVKGAWLESVRFPRVAVPGASAPATFWESTVNTPDEDGTQRREAATSFAVYAAANAKSFTVDSRWLAEQYQRHNAPDGEILTFQIWAPDAETTSAMRTAVLERCSELGQIEYRNTDEIAAPDVFLASGDYTYDNAILWIENQSASERQIELDAVTWSAANPQSRLDFHFTRTVPPGRSSVILSMPGRLNGVVYASVAGSGWSDMIYFADGSWFSFGESAPPDWNAPECPSPRPGPNDLAAAGCAQLITSIPADGWRGIGRSFGTYTRSDIDVAEMAAVSFFARGVPRTAEVQVASRSDQGQRIVHHAFFTPSESGRQITIPFDWLEGVNEARDVPFSGERVIEIAWNYSGSPHASTDLTIGNVFFTADMVAETAPPAPSVPIAGAVPLGARFATSEEAAEAAVLYRRAGEQDFIRVPLRQTLDVFGGELPGQPLGSKLDYFYEFTDVTGRAITIPPDAPYDAHPLLFSALPLLLIDDFDDQLINNRQGGASSTFHSPGGSVEAVQDGADLRLAYDVGPPGSFSGWVSTFRRPIDASPYDSVVLRVRGDAGGEMVKLGLGDSSGREHKLLLGKYLEGGLSTEWREARVPLAAFSTIDAATLRKVIVVFENGVAAGAGATELDEIRLQKSEASLPLLIDNFDDRAHENALGGNLWTTTGGTATLSTTHTGAASAGAQGSGYRITAAGSPGSWATAGFDLRGLDAASQTQLALSMRGGRGGEIVHVYLASGDIRRYVSVMLTNEWQRIAIPLTEFSSQGVSLAALDRLELVWEFRDFDDTVDLDDVAIESP